MLAVGILIMMVATNVIPSEDEKFHVPRWVVFVCGMLFVTPGMAELLPGGKRTARFAFSFMLACFGTIGGAVALLGDSAGFSGGIPFVSQGTNATIARWVFGGGALLCFLFAGLVLCGKGKMSGNPVKEAENEHE
ncbi:hypothetical protein HG15A2_05830 [Adhaeretor mobilis]|uniref:Uncharacterized protein n=2 Tax=Adhaeretor mobilis TaxID=1930276 RepID=A0A517MR13_9BACT|nr:hypothetical protein HG15A2_05830 [Adhaeretor mobilis]